MKMKGRKTIVFFINLAVLVTFYYTTPTEVLSNLGQLIIIMIVGNGATYIGGQVADEWQRSKYWRNELDGR